MNMGKSVVSLNTPSRAEPAGAVEPSPPAAPARTATPATAAGAAAPGGNASLPLMLMALALLVAFGAQAYLLLGERQALQAAHAAQQQTVDNAGRLRASLDALAADTQRMADGGNPNAALLVSELRKRGITINAAAQPVAAAASAAR